ncbi:MAG TPA: O-antigen ligase family protein, partial [Terriglobales bacterium]|nr:O-antigen ligase family protein [Terriglobales bacterium]
MISILFRKTSRWIFFAALVYAPWAYGATTSASINITNWMLLVALGLWGAELLTSGRRPDISPFLLILTGALVCVGGWMALNARSIYDSEFSVFVPLRNLAPFLAGSVDYANSVAWMMRGALLLGTILFVSDLSQSSRRLLRLWYVIGLVGGSIAFLGLLQKATGAQMIFWQPPPPPEYGVTTFFATYFYHGNAGAFLNLVWPLSAGLVIRAFTSQSQPGMRALWTIVFIITIAGVLANTSRMAQVVALLLLVLIGPHFGPGLLRRLPGAQKSVAVAGALALVLALIALAQATHLEQPLNRWQAVSEQIPSDARWQASRVALGALPRAGFFGFGPGTFRVVFPGYNIGSGHPVPGSWRFLHEDWLQAMLEWGWLGSSLWALLFFGGITVGILSYRRYGMRDWLPRRRVMQPLAMTALAGVAIHALVDYPFQIESIQLYVAAYLG